MSFTFTGIFFKILNRCKYHEHISLLDPLVNQMVLATFQSLVLEALFVEIQHLEVPSVDLKSKGMEDAY